MDDIITFLEGMISFISPCMLPMLPIYLIYFSGDPDGKSDNKKVLINSIGFVLGFSLVFVILGALSGLLGKFLNKYSTVINMVMGTIVIIFGLYHMGVLKLNLFSGQGSGKQIEIKGFFSAFLFGIIFSISWTPCIGVFLSSALTIASQ